MSCYEWEQGTIKLPTKVFAKFRREYINRYNGVQEDYLNTIKRYRERVLLLGKGKRGFNFEDVMLDMTEGWTEYDTVKSLFVEGRNKPLMPTKKIVNFVTGKDNSFEVDRGSAGIGFNKKEHTVTWYVEENNHAIDDARATKEARIFFEMLGRVEFTRGSGGVIIGNNEYNRDDMCEGGGGNYVTGTYGNRK